MFCILLDCSFCGKWPNLMIKLVAAVGKLSYHKKTWRRWPTTAASMTCCIEGFILLIWSTKMRWYSSRVGWFLNYYTRDLSSSFHVEAWETICSGRVYLFILFKSSWSCWGEKIFWSDVKVLGLFFLKKFVALPAIPYGQILYRIWNGILFEVLFNYVRIKSVLACYLLWIFLPILFANPFRSRLFHSSLNEYE